MVIYKLSQMDKKMAGKLHLQNQRVKKTP